MHQPTPLSDVDIGFLKEASANGYDINFLTGYIDEFNDYQQKWASIVDAAVVKHGPMIRVQLGRDLAKLSEQRGGCRIDDPRVQEIFNYVHKTAMLKAADVDGPEGSMPDPAAAPAAAPATPWNNAGGYNGGQAGWGGGIGGILGLILGQLLFKSPMLGALLGGAGGAGIGGMYGDKIKSLLGGLFNNSPAAAAGGGTPPPAEITRTPDAARGPQSPPDNIPGTEEHSLGQLANMPQEDINAQVQQNTQNLDPNGEEFATAANQGKSPAEMGKQVQNNEETVNLNRMANMTPAEMEAEVKGNHDQVYNQIPPGVIQQHNQKLKADALDQAQRAARVTGNQMDQAADQSWLNDPLKQLRRRGTEMYLPGVPKIPFVTGLPGVPPVSDANLEGIKDFGRGVSSDVGDIRDAVSGFITGPAEAAGEWSANGGPGRAVDAAKNAPGAAYRAGASAAGNLQTGIANQIVPNAPASQSAAPVIPKGLPMPKPPVPAPAPAAAPLPNIQPPVKNPFTPAANPLTDLGLNKGGSVLEYWLSKQAYTSSGSNPLMPQQQSQTGGSQPVMQPQPGQQTNMVKPLLPPDSLVPGKPGMKFQMPGQMSLEPVGLPPTQTVGQQMPQPQPTNTTPQLDFNKQQHPLAI